MDQNEGQMIVKKSDKYHQFLRRSLQLVFSVSVFCFFVWQSSGFSIHLQSFNAYISTCLFSMLTHTLERKYMFLICNGILAFLAINSSLPASVSGFDTEFQEASNLSESETKQLPVSDIAVVRLGSPENVPLMVEEQVEKKEECYEKVLEEQENETWYTETKEKDYIAEEDQNELGKDEGTESGVKVTEDDDTTMTTNEDLELENTDELNRKFEEFIRKMKEEIRIEAQRHLIAV